MDVRGIRLRAGEDAYRGDSHADEAGGRPNKPQDRTHAVWADVDDGIRNLRPGKPLTNVCPKILRLLTCRSPFDLNNGNAHYPAKPSRWDGAASKSARPAYLNRSTNRIARRAGMKKVFVVALALSILAGIAVAQSGMGSDMKKDSSASAPLKDIKGTVKAEGGKTWFVADKDKKSWEVVNPEALKGHEGHHVQVSAHVYADKNQIHVMSVKMLPASKMKDDSMKNDNMSK